VWWHGSGRNCGVERPEPPLPTLAPTAPTRRWRSPRALTPSGRFSAWAATSRPRADRVPFFGCLILILRSNPDHSTNFSPDAPATLPGCVTNHDRASEPGHCWWTSPGQAHASPGEWLVREARPQRWRRSGEAPYRVTPTQERSHCRRAEPARHVDDVLAGRSLLGPDLRPGASFYYRRRRLMIGTMSP